MNTVRVQVATLRVAATAPHVTVGVGQTALKRHVSTRAFMQLCRYLRIPPQYLQRLPATLACQLITHELAKLRYTSSDEVTIKFTDELVCEMLFHHLLCNSTVAPHRKQAAHS